MLSLRQFVAAGLLAVMLLAPALAGVITLSAGGRGSAPAVVETTFFGATLPTLPQLTVDTTYSLPDGNTWTATNTASNDAAGTGTGNRTDCGFQYALDNAALNDVIVLTAGDTYTGPFTLPNKATGSGWIYVISDQAGSLPAVGTRITTSDATYMPTIEVADSVGGAIQTENTAHHYRFVGIEVRPAAGDFVYALVEIGGALTDTANVPHHIIFDRSYIHGNSGEAMRRAVAGNGNYVAIVESILSEAKEVGADTQAFWAYNCQGPILLRNNLLEAAGEVVLIGGSQPPSLDAEWIPSDITIIDNYIHKPTALDEGSYTSKNLLELKLGKRVLIESNRMENQQGMDQKVAAILITPRDEAGGAPFFPGAEVSDVTIRYNRILNVGQGIHISGSDNGDGVSGRTSQQLQRTLIRHNMIAMNQQSDARFFQITGNSQSDYAPLDLIIDHNTAIHQNGTSPGKAAVMSEVTSTVKTKRFVFTNNIIHMGAYGWWGSGQAQIAGTLAAFFESDYKIEANAFIDTATTGQTFSEFPSGNYNVANIAAIGLTDYASEDWSLDGGSSYAGVGVSAPSTGDGSDLGANMALVAN